MVSLSKYTSLFNTQKYDVQPVDSSLFDAFSGLPCSQYSKGTGCLCHFPFILLSYLFFANLPMAYIHAQH